MPFSFFDSFPKKHNIFRALQAHTLYLFNFILYSVHTSAPYQSAWSTLPWLVDSIGPADSRAQTFRL